MTHEERGQVGGGALRALRSSDRAPSTEGCHEDGDYRSSCDDLLCADLHVFSEANCWSICTTGGSPSALSVHRWPVCTRRNVDTIRGTASAFPCGLIAPLVWVPHASAPLEQTAPPRATPRLLVDALPLCTASVTGPMSQCFERVTARSVRSVASCSASPLPDPLAAQSSG